jgi:hypothetical protein
MFAVSSVRYQALAVTDTLLTCSVLTPEYENRAGSDGYLASGDMHSAVLIKYGVPPVLMSIKQQYPYGGASFTDRLDSWRR